MTRAPDAGYPEKYWHCLVRLRGRKGRDYAVENDLTFVELERRVLNPWRSDMPFPISGMVIPSRNEVETIQIAHTSEPKERYAHRHNMRMENSGITDWETDRRLLPLDQGKDYTHVLLFEMLDARAPSPDVGLVLRLCERLPRAAQALGSRKRNRPPYRVKDEYDVQDLLHAILRAYLKHTVTEEPLGKVAGARSARADLAIEELGILIEVKYARGPQDQSRMVEEFAQDLVLYSNWAPLQHFLYLCYNTDDLSDPEALQKLEGQQKVGGREFRTYVVLA